MNCVKRSLKCLWSPISVFLNTISIGQIPTGLFYKQKLTYSSWFGGAVTLLAIVIVTILSIFALTDVLNHNVVSSTEELKQIDLMKYEPTIS